MADLVIPSRSEGPPLSSWTEREIRQQPLTLTATQDVLRAHAGEIEAFLSPLLARPELRIVLTGAGTSAFIGESLAPWLAKVLDQRVEAVATTDIVGTPDLAFGRDEPTLLVSFGRSGSSPESVAAAEIADARLTDVHHLVITCNADGALARRTGANNHVIVLPDATHDRSFAMTSSFTAMMLAALSALTGVADLDDRVEAIAAASAHALGSDVRMQALAARDFQRVVYLGSGVFKGLAREAALKLMELSDGAVITAFDTPLGFRHGPKTIVTDRTLVVIFLSNDPLTRCYDEDLEAELRADGRAGAVVTISARPHGGDSIVIDGGDGMADVDLLFPFIVPAQLLALAISLRLGLTPDQPNASGTVNRVVQGVRIHSAQS